jgi:hypothetical protein
MKDVQRVSGPLRFAFNVLPQVFIMKSPARGTII